MSRSKGVRNAQPSERLSHVLNVAPAQNIGVHFQIFQRMNHTNFQTGVYVYAVHPQSNDLYFAFGRKVPPKTRVPYYWQKTNPGVNAPVQVVTGAAGTEEAFHGKWASLGGGADKNANTPLDAAIIELNDEAAIRPEFHVHDVHVPWSKHAPAKPKLRLVLADQPNASRQFYVFVFMMHDWVEFLRFFPHIDDRQNVRGGQSLVSASHGEIDYTASYTLEDIAKYQSSALSSNNNHFTAYTLRTLQGIVIPALFPRELTPSAQGVVNLNVVQDTPREPSGWRTPRQSYR